MRRCAPPARVFPRTPAQPLVNQLQSLKRSNMLSGLDTPLSDWRTRALELEAAIKHAIIGQDQAIRRLVIAVFARGHVLLEGDVGVGKTTLLRALARVLGGQYARIEGTIDLMPNDLVYHTYINEAGRPAVDPGPLLTHGENLATFFFNEVNRARPQVHSLLLRVMAEKSVTAFNREYYFPHLQVFADRNRVEKEETFELPAASQLDTQDAAELIPHRGHDQKPDHHCHQVDEGDEIERRVERLFPALRRTAEIHSTSHR